MKEVLSNIVNYDENKKNVAIIGWFDGPNYGSKLVHWSIYKLFNKLGWNSCFIWPPHAEKYKFSNFARSEYNITKCTGIRKLSILNRYFDAFSVGSDQYWNYRLDYFGNFRFLDFANTTKRILSCCTSFGHDELFYPKDKLEEIKFLLKRFNTITVRENSAAELIKKFFGIDSIVLTDPTLLLEPDDFIGLTKKSNLELENNKYILVYLLDPNEEKKQKIAALSRSFNMPVKTLVDIQGYKGKAEYMKEFNVVGEEIGRLPSVYDFVNCFKNAAYVVTDSFHGTCFSIIFNKSFCTFANFRRGGIRFELFNKIGCGRRIQYDYDFNIQSILDNLDYQVVNDINAKNRSYALNIFEATLNASDNRELSEFDMIRNLI